MPKVTTEPRFGRLNFDYQIWKLNYKLIEELLSNRKVNKWRGQGLCHFYIGNQMQQLFFLAVSTSYTVLTEKVIRLQPWVPGTISVLHCPNVNEMWQYNIIILALFHFHKKSHTALCMIPWILSNSRFILSKKKVRCLGNYEKINWITMDTQCD